MESSGIAQDAEFRMSQRELAEAFGVTPPTVSEVLRGFDRKVQIRRSKEGSRHDVTRKVITYSQDAIFRVAMASKGLHIYYDICQRAGIAPLLVHQPRREVEFSAMLMAFLGGKYHVERQFRVLRYAVDFYIPSHGVVIEYDEREHQRSFRKACDMRRQAEIEEALSAKVVRVAEGNELGGLFDVAAALVSQQKASTY